VSFAKYLDYRSSGLSWVDRVPAHWSVLPIRAVARLESGHTPSRNHPEYWENCSVPWFTLGDVWQIREAGRDVVFETEEKVSELGLANSAARKLPAGTVMLSRTASVGFSAIMGVEMATTQDFANWVCGPRVLPRYLLYVFRSMQGEFSRLKMGSTHHTIYMPDIQALRFALPPMDEQAVICSFIEQQTASIDQLIADQRQLIELLNEKRQAVISHAVTKGLNPDAPMKPSGVEWLGDVPAHWEVGKCGRQLSVQSGFAFPSAGFTLDSSETRLLRGINVGVQSIKWDDVVFWRRVSGDALDSYVLRIGDVVMGMDRPVISEGVRVAKLTSEDVPSLLLQRVARLRPTSQLNPEFLLRILSSPMFVAHFAPETTGVSVPHISPDQIASFVIPLPPRREQDEIVARLSQLISTADALTRDAERAIALLQERRTALISAAVTGQIDVRGLARAVPNVAAGPMEVV
jgi:type I restriction enzyme, S subunit